METAEKTRWVSAVIGQDKYKTMLTTDSHTLIGDEPFDNGGEDRGPGPGDLLWLGLASCTAITLRMYANRKGYDVKQIEVKVHSREVEGKTVFYRDIEVIGNIDEVVRKRMLQIADACPVHKMLTRPVEVLSKLT